MSEKKKALIRDAQLLEKEGFRIKRINDDICIDGLDKHDKYKYVLRPGTADLKVFRQVIVSNEYHRILNLIREDGNVGSIENIVDAGSNIGLSSLYFLKEMPSVRIFSIEPDVHNYHHQLKNIDINGANDSIVLMKKALWSNDKDLLRLSDDFRDGDTWSKSVVNSNDYEISDALYVEAVTLRDISVLIGVDKYIDLLKIDVEGAEKTLFGDNDFVNVLGSKVRYMCLEIHDELGINDYILNVLRNLNFDYFTEGETTFAKNRNLLF